MSTLGVAAVAAGALVLALVAVGLIYQAQGVQRDAARFPPPGMLVDVGGYRLHLRSMGEGSPPVVLESGVGASSINWLHVQRELSAVTRVISYDRAGLGWSDRAPTPRTSAAIAEELHTLLARAGVEPPFVLVGHSFGGFVARSFYRRFPRHVGGLVFVDTIFPGDWLRMSREQQRMMRGGALFARIGALLARLGLVRALLNRLASGAPSAPRTVLSLFGSTATAVVTRMVGEVQKMPVEMRPAIQAHWSQSKGFSSLASHLSNLPVSAADAAAVTAFHDIPVAVLCAGGLRSDSRRQHESLAAMSANGRFVPAETTGHWVHLDDPSLVAGIVRRVVEDVRQSTDTS